MVDKRLIFTVTSGRSGTAYLAHLLTGLPGIIALHEPKPRFSELLPEARIYPVKAAEFLKNIKLPFIASLPEITYVEASHYLAKGFLAPMLDLGVVPDLILLRRQPRKIGISWFLIGGRIKNLLNGKISKHIIGPNEPNFLPAKRWREWNDYQLCYWYALETHFRAGHYAKLVVSRGGNVFETHLKPLTRGQNYQRLLEWLNVPKSVALARAVDTALRQRVVNDKSELKLKKTREPELFAMDLDALEAQVHRDCGLPDSIEELLRSAIALC